MRSDVFYPFERRREFVGAREERERRGRERDLRGKGKRRRAREGVKNVVRVEISQCKRCKGVKRRDL